MTGRPKIWKTARFVQRGGIICSILPIVRGVCLDWGQPQHFRTFVLASIIDALAVAALWNVPSVINCDLGRLKSYAVPLPEQK